MNTADTQSLADTDDCATEQKGDPGAATKLRLVANPDDVVKHDVNGDIIGAPVGWAVKRLADMAIIVAGQSPDGDDVRKGTPSKDDLDFHQGNADFGDTRTARSGKIISRSIAPRTCAQDYLLMSVRAPVGALNFASEELCFGRGLCAIKVNADNNSPYLRFHLAARMSALDRMASGSTFLAVTNQQVASLQLVVPPLAEQIRIAAVLTTQETQIQDLLALRDDERARLAWLTEELLSGRVRVVERIDGESLVVARDESGNPVEVLSPVQMEANTSWKSIFSNDMQQIIPTDWDLPGVKTYSKSISGATPPTKEKKYWGGGLTWVTPKDMDSPNGPYLTGSEKTLTKDGYSFMAQKAVPKGAVVFSTRGSIGKVSCTTEEIRISQSCEAFVFDGQSPEFMVYLFRKHMHELKTRGAGTTFMSITKKDIESMILPIPEKKEQQRIAAVLSTQERQVSDIDALINGEQERLAWLTEELLSGRIRVEASNQESA